MKDQDIILKLTESLKAAQSSLKAAEKWAEKLGGNLGMPINSFGQTTNESTLEINEDENGKVIEGIFDGQNMSDKDGSIYPVPANYASKSKLVEGDRLKLSIAPNGAFIYKQIELVPRTLIVGHLVLDGSQYQVLVDKKIYNVLYASVTFYRAKVGDQVTIIIPEGKTPRFAAIENVIPEKVVEQNSEITA